MSANRDQRPGLRTKAEGALAALSHGEREALLIKCWMSHDARWFTAVAMNHGMQAANRANQAAARGEGKVEARRLARALGLGPVQNAADFLLAQEAMIGLLGPDLLDYDVVQTGDDGWRIAIKRCFAFDNVSRAGVADQYECGILPRVQGWLEGLGLPYEMTPSLGKCLKAQGQECAYAFTLKGPAGPAATGTPG